MTHDECFKQKYKNGAQGALYFLSISEWERKKEKNYCGLQPPP